MTLTKAITRLLRLVEDWRYEEAQLCKQFGNVIAPQSMRAQRIKDTEVIDEVVKMLERVALHPSKRRTTCINTLSRP